MEQKLFSNSNILEWLQYYAENTTLDLEKVKIIDITRKNKNLIPTVEANNTVLVFTEAGHQDIFYRMWDAGLGECEVWYNEGSDPTGPILHKPVKEMIDRGINASAGMLIFNQNARSTYKIGIHNSNFSRGSVRYVGAEIRAVILSKMNIAQNDVVCVISGASIAVEAAMLAPEGTIIAVEYSASDRKTVEENANKFGLNNIEVLDKVDEDSFKEMPVPNKVMMVASASMEKEIEYFLSINPHIEFVIYTLDFQCAASLPALLDKYDVEQVEVIQVAISKLNAKHNMVSEPAPWLIYGMA